MKKKTDKIVILVALIILNLGFLYTTWNTVNNFIRFQEGEIITGAVIDTYTRGTREHRTYYALVELTIDDELVTKEIRVKKNSTSLNGVTVISSSESPGSEIEIAILETEDQLEIAIADDVLDLWPKLFYYIMINLLILGSTWLFINEMKDD
jgi:hypothetical protein